MRNIDTKKNGEEPRDDKDNPYDRDVECPALPVDAGAEPSGNEQNEHSPVSPGIEHRDADNQVPDQEVKIAQSAIEPGDDKDNPYDRDVECPTLPVDAGVEPSGNEQNEHSPVSSGIEHRDADNQVPGLEVKIAQSAIEPRDDKDNPYDNDLEGDFGTPGDQTGSLDVIEPTTEKTLLKGLKSDAVNDKDNRNGDDADESSDESLSFLRPICIGIIAIVIVWVIRLFLPLIQAVAESSGGMRVAYLIMLLIPVGVIVYAIWTAFRIFMRLPPGVNCNITDYKDTDGEFLQDKLNRLRSRLIKKYLLGFRDHPGKLSGKDTFDRVKCLCCKPGEDGYIENTEDWCKEYQKFQEELKLRAGKVRDKYANAIALFTITSPKSQLDILGTLFFSTRMIFDIARIFNKRMTKFGALKLTISWAVHIYAVGEMQAIGGKLGAVFGKSVSMLMGLFTKASLGDTIGKVVDRAVSLGIEGGVNKKLTRLLGDKAIKEFVAVKGL